MAEEGWSQEITDDTDSITCDRQKCGGTQKHREESTLRTQEGGPWHRLKTVFLVIIIVLLAIWLVVYVMLSRMALIHWYEVLLCGTRQEAHLCRLTTSALSVRLANVVCLKLLVPVYYLTKIFQTLKKIKDKIEDYFIDSFDTVNRTLAANSLLQSWLI